MKACLLLVLVSCAVTFSLPSQNDINYKLLELLISTYKSDEAVKAPVTVRATRNDMTYYFHSRNNDNDPHIISNHNAQDLDRSQHFDARKQTFFIIHGWVDSHTAEVNRLVKAALLARYDLNVIVVDWAPVAGLSYSEAQAAVVTVGGFVAEFVRDMMNHFGISSSLVSLIGHSLGAHICGNAGAALQNKPHQIIGLDPAAPSFTVANINNRLDPSDANCVKILHTNGRFLGFSTSIGDVDYYPNGGQVQAGCGIDLLGTCSHARAFLYLAEAIAGGSFTSTLCGSYSDFQNNRCSANKKSLMGALDVDTSVVGDYFLDTNSNSPYAKG